MNEFARSIAVIVLLLLLVANPIAAQSVDPVVDQAKSLLNAGQNERAVDVLERGVAEKPNVAARHYWLATAYGSLAADGSMFKVMSLAGKARDEFLTAVKLDGSFIDARLALMEFYVMMPGFMGGGIDKAREQATEIRKRDTAAGHHAFAEVAEAAKDVNAARAEYAAAVRESPSSPKPHYWYGVLLMLKEKNYKASADVFDAALRLNPNFMAARFQIGHLAALSGANLARGEEALQKYLTYKPADDDDPPLYRAHYWLGMIYEKQGKKAEARAQFQASLRLRPQQRDAKDALKRVS